MRQTLAHADDRKNAAETGASASLAGHSASADLRLAGNKKGAPILALARSGPHACTSGEGTASSASKKKDAPPRAEAQQAERQVPAPAGGGSRPEVSAAQPAEGRPRDGGGNTWVPLLTPEGKRAWIASLRRELEEAKARHEK